MELARCPVCKARPPYPDAPQRDRRGGRTVMAGIKCPGCPATLDIFEDTGKLCAFTPNQPFTVKVKKNRHG